MTEDQRDQLGAALGRVPSGLFIVTVRAGDATNAFLASWVQQASFEPPALTVGVKNGRPAAELLEQDGATFAVNVLEAGDSAMLKHFGRGFEPGQECYEGLRTERASTGVEVLPDTLAWLECKPTHHHVSGDHVTIFGEILQGKLRDGGGDPYIWTRKSGFGY